jgi:hypothetical protein
MLVFQTIAHPDRRLWLRSLYRRRLLFLDPVCDAPRWRNLGGRHLLLYGGAPPPGGVNLSVAADQVC